MGLLNSLIQGYKKVGEVVNLLNPVNLLVKTAPVTAPIVTAGAVAVITKSPTATIGTYVGTNALVGALKENPQKTISTISNLPSQVSNFGQNLGGLAINPSIEKAKETILENPVLAGASILALGAGAVKATASVANTLAIQELSEKVSVPSFLDTGQGVVSAQDLPVTPSSNQIDTGLPTTAPQRETTSISPTTRRRSKNKKVNPPQIRLNNNISINNFANSRKKRYLKECILV